MSQRVLATEEAVQAIGQIKSILSDQFLSTINNLKSQGTILSDPNQWDGSLAVQFRSELWPQCTRALDQALASLDELHGQLQNISTAIMQAGGNVA
jgi:uncharacterized protein YukE